MELPREKVEVAIRKFVGDIEQKPPVYSALKIGGMPAYKRARQGEEVTLEARPVKIYGIELVNYDWPLLQIRVDCGRGTYIRSLARDIGEALRTRGYLTELKRTRIGPYKLEDAVKIETLQEKGVAGFLNPF